MRLVIDSQLSEIRRATDLVEQFRVRHGLTQMDADAIGVVLDEVLSNSIRHGLAIAPAHEISVALEFSEGEIRIEVEDDGVAYDPTKAPPADIGGTLEERKASGLGLAFVRMLTDSVEYNRTDGRNRLVMRKRIVPAEA